MSVTPKSLVVGNENTDYDVVFTAAIPVHDKDELLIDFPAAIGAPRGGAARCVPTPVRSGKSCLTDATNCSSARGSITVQLRTKPGCDGANEVFAFTIQGVRNAQTMVPSEITTATLSSDALQGVAVFKPDAPIVITCTTPGALDLEKVKVEQSLYIKPGSTKSKWESARDFGAEALYTLRFTPKNPITQAAWIKVTYPTSVAIEDEAEFVKACSIQTATSCTGADCCILDATKRIIWFYGAFIGQGQFTSEVAMEFPMRNPVTNFGEVTPTGYTAAQAAAYAKEQAFHIETFDFDIAKDYAYLTAANYDAASVKKFETFVKADPAKYVIHGIDELPGNSKKPILKCEAPCYTCLDAKPTWCTSCWGPGTLDPADATNKLTFLMTARNGQGATCKEECDAGSTTNGNYITPKTAGKADQKRKYGVCTACDIPCGTCKG